MTTNLHEMFGLPDKKVYYKARLLAATEHMRSEVKDVFRELGLQEDDPCQRRLMDACNAWAIIKMRREETDIHRVLLPKRVSLMLAVALITGMAGFVAGLYCSADMEASAVRFSWTSSHEDRIAISPVPI